MFFFTLFLPESVGDDTSSPSPRKRLQRVEILKIAEPCPLIDPSQVVVTQGEVLVADPVLTPIGNFGMVFFFLELCRSVTFSYYYSTDRNL